MDMEISKSSQALVEVAVSELRELATLYDRLSLKPEFSLTKRLWWGQQSKALARIANESEAMFKNPL